MACRTDRVGIWIDLTIVLLAILDIYGSFIDLVMYWWNLFSFNQGVGSCLVIHEDVSIKG